MPKVPEVKFEDDENTAKFRELKKGTVLNILAVEYKTQKGKTGSYESATVTLKDGSKVYGGDTGVVRALKQATEEFGESFEESDPLVATIDTYTDSFNNERICLV